MSDVREVSGRPTHAVAAPRQRMRADVRDFLQGARCPASVYQVCDTADLAVSHRLSILQANVRLGSGTGRLLANWDLRVEHPALHIEAQDVPSEAPLPLQVGATVLVPVLGRIPGGPLNLVNQAFESAFLLDRRPVGDGRLFMLKVVGMSMVGVGINDGNWVVVHQQEYAKNGEIVAALVDGEVTVKTLRREPGVLELMPENPDYDPIPVAELTILGTVVGVVRQDSQ